MCGMCDAAGMAVDEAASGGEGADAGNVTV